MLMLFASEVPASTWERLGTAGIVAVLLLAALYWRDKRANDVEASLKAELAAERAKVDDVTNRLISTVQQAIPVLDRVDRALERRERQ